MAADSMTANTGFLIERSERLIGGSESHGEGGGGHILADRSCVSRGAAPGRFRRGYFAGPPIGHSQTSDSGPPLPLARVLPSGEKASDSSRFFGPVSVRTSAPDCGSQSLMVRSLHPLARVLPSGEKVTESTSAVWPLSVCRGLAVSASQSRTVVSLLLLASSFPLGEKVTHSRSPVCPRRTWRAWPVCGFHSRMVRSELALASVLPPGE